MGGNVVVPVVPQYEVQNTPDLTVLQQMNDPIIMVSKMVKNGNRSEPKLVVNGRTGLSVGDILELQDALPKTHGAGVYRFEVTDQETTAKTMWQLRLDEAGDAATVAAAVGVAAPMVAAPQPTPVQSSVVNRPMMLQAAPQATPVYARPAGGPVVPPAADAYSLGNGWIFNPTPSLLTAPDGRIFNWRPGQNLPDLTPMMAAVTTPVQPQQSGSIFSSAASPELEAIRRENEANKAALAALREEQRENQRRHEIADLREGFTKSIEANNARVEALIAKLTERPTEDPRLTRMEQELKEERQRATERERLDAMRAETAAKIEALANLVREQSANKESPMITFMANLMQQTQAQTAETIRAIRDTASTQLSAAQGSAMTPERLISLLDHQAQLLRDNGSSAINEKIMSVMNTLFDQVIRIRRAEAEFAGPSGPNWVDVVKELSGKAGGALQAYANMKARETQANAQVEIARAKAAAIQAQVGARAADGAPAIAPVEVLPPQKRPLQVVPPDLSKATRAELHKLFDAEKDEAFFGPFWPSVKELRDEMAKPGEYKPEDVAKFVMDAREFIAAAAANGTVPRAAEMLAFGQYAYLVERLVPDANEGFRDSVVTSLRKQIEEENPAAGSEEGAAQG